MQQQKKKLPIHICNFKINYIRKYSDTMKNTAATITRDGTGTYILLKNGLKNIVKGKINKIFPFMSISISNIS